MQEEKMIGTLTVFEHLWNIALLRLSNRMPYRKKMNRIEEVMDELGISHIRDTFIGTDLERGISGGERRRLAIATELLTDPPVLFLDEVLLFFFFLILFLSEMLFSKPTTGLDSHTAHNLMKTLKNLAHTSQRTILMTIHQVIITLFLEPRS